ncbi:transporter [Streptomyces mashuensis]|uniref:Transporter n=1 Tax=Streptomyces mashuensis TaxID=33904 RepID=A0A919EDA0_9ACTN|nr:transporter [Streptomyces mashuensis]GHF47402.1 transporter [Streptomyces mashuensis]
MTTAAPAPAPVAGAGAAPTASAAVLTRTLAGLKLALLRNGLKQSSGRKAVWITSIVLTALFAALQLLGLIALRGNDHAATFTVLLAVLWAFGWAVMPLFFPAGDETMDPSRLVMLPLRPAPLMVALLTAALIGIGPGFTVVLFVGSAIATAHGAAAVAVAVLAVPLALLICVALSRAVTTANVRLLTSRRGRDLALLSGIVIAVGAQFVNLGLNRLSKAGGLEALQPVADVVRWIPPGSALDAVRAASEGQYGLAAAELALSAAVLAALMTWWQQGLTKIMTAPDASTIGAAAPERKRGGRAGRDGAAADHRPAGLAGLLPDTRTGAVMLRSLRYAWRDPKTKASWVSGLAAGALVPFVNAVQGSGSVWLALFAATMLGLQMYNQFGQDGPAFWMVLQTLGTAREAYAELRARTLALALIALPYITLIVTTTAWLLGKWQQWAEVMGVSLALLGGLFATGALTSVLAPYSIPQDSGFKNVAPGQASIAWLGMLGSVVGAALCAPLLGLVIALHVTDTHDLLWTVLPLGAAYGLLVTWAGLRVAAPKALARLPEILTAVTKA